MTRKNSKIGILKYFSSNFYSLASAFDKISVNYQLSENFKDLMNNEKIVIPGVGNMKYFFSSCSKNQLSSEIKSYIENDGTILGICLGMQAFLNMSEESNSETLGLINGKVESLKKNFKLYMNVGFRELLLKNQNKTTNKLLNGINKTDKFYFLHKYHCKIDDNETNINFSYFENKEIISLINKKNLIGTQFHPELSGNPGLKFLENFSKLKID